MLLCPGLATSISGGKEGRQSGGGWVVVREMSLTTLVTRESGPWVRKAPSIIHHTPLNPLSFQPCHSDFLLFYLLPALRPPSADGVTLPFSLWSWWKREDVTERIIQRRMDWSWCKRWTLEKIMRIDFGIDIIIKWGFCFVSHCGEIKNTSEVRRNKACEVYDFCADMREVSLLQRISGSDPGSSA